MRTPRIHVAAPLQAGQSLSLPAQAGIHLTRVLRLAPGAPLLLFNGDGHDYAATLSTLGASVRVDVHARQAAAAPESSLRLTLAQGIARGDKMDLILQKATELGATRIVPLLTARTEVKLDAARADKRMAHWQAVLVAACEQCGRACLPVLDAPQPLMQWLAKRPAATEQAPLLVLDPQATLRVRELPVLQAATLVIGPEGGLDGADHVMLRASGARGLRLGPRVLRTETAGLAALAALQALAGDA